MYRTIRVCDVCARRFRIKSASQLRCSEKCKKKGASVRAAEYNADYQSAKGFRERYNARRKAWRQKNAERERGKHRQYVENNRERVSRYAAEYAKKRKSKPREIRSDYISEGTLTEYLRAYYQANQERLKAQNKEWRNRNKDRVDKTRRRYERENRKRRNAQLAEKRKNNPAIRLVVYIRNRITRSLRLAKASKASTTHTYVGMKGPELMQYLLSHPSSNSRFTADNYGKAWHCDHIRPLASFDLSDTKQAERAFHFTNLQPLSVEENLSKGSLFAGQRHRHKKSSVTRRQSTPSKPKRGHKKPMGKLARAAYS